MSDIAKQPPSEAPTQEPAAPDVPSSADADLGQPESAATNGQAPTSPTLMPFVMPQDVVGSLSPIAMQAVGKMSDEQKAMFISMYQTKKRNVGGMEALAILFPIQLFLLNKVGLGVAFILTFGGAGVWWIVEWFLTPSRVRAYNAEVAEQILMQMRFLSS